MTPIKRDKAEAKWWRERDGYIRRKETPLDAFFELLWRGFNPDFVGPVVAPMQLWMMQGAKLHPGGPYPGSIGWADRLGEQYSLFAENAA